MARVFGWSRDSRAERSWTQPFSDLRCQLETVAPVDLGRVNALS